MNDISNIVFYLEQKIEILIKRYNEIKSDKENLKQTILGLESENQLLNEALTANKDKINTLKTTNALLGSNDFKRETKLKINTLIREIDACIVALSD